MRNLGQFCEKLIFCQKPLDLSSHLKILLPVSTQFSLKYKFPFQILRFLLQNHLVLLKDLHLKNMLLKSAKNSDFFFFFFQNYTLKYFFTLN